MIQIEFAAWLIPATITGCALAFCVVAELTDPGPRWIGDWWLHALLWMPAIIVSLISWLIWAVLP